MEYFVFFECGLIVVILLWVLILWRKATVIRRNIIENILAKELVEKKFFTTLVLEDWADYINRLPRKQIKCQIAEITKGKIKSQIATITNQELRNLVCFLVNGRGIENLSKGDCLSQLLYAQYLISEKKLKQADNVLADIGKISYRFKGLRLLILAKINIAEGQLREATEFAFAAAECFKKQRWLYEEAATYNILGDIYRLAGIDDTAEIMLKSALKIWQKINCNIRTCETLGCLGILCAAQGRFEEAEDYFVQAENNDVGKSIKNLNLSIVCHHAMLNVVKGDYKQALKMIDGIDCQKQNDGIKALAKLVVARAKSKQGHYKKACDLADEASRLYVKMQDYMAACEAQYLAAEICLQFEKYHEADERLHKILHFMDNRASLFSKADVYVALGVGMLGKDELEKAKDYFYEALNMEISQNHFVDAALIYANLAEVFRRQGEIKEEKQCLESVLQYADGNSDIFINAQKKLKELNQRIS